MKKLIALALAGLFALALSPAMAQTTSSKMSDKATMQHHMMMKQHHMMMKHHHMMMKQHHMMMKHHMMMNLKMKHAAMKHAAAKPAVNPAGALNADKGASPNPGNDVNGVHTTAAPSPTPVP